MNGESYRKIINFSCHTFVPAIADRNLLSIKISQQKERNDNGNESFNCLLI